ncbi:cadherin domain-containing protein [Dolichospermum circinale]|uniref:cadherin domain-containing protein n=1 Tax=Dolichospermum circinale TaxID=109265 RepID=UPI000427BE03|nr:cadherin domain-containing protein [Dolichospermum circinale]
MPNQAPTNLTLNNSAISRTIQEGETIVIDFISQDPVTGKTFTYELVSGDGDTDNSLFTIVDNQLIANTVLDFETKNSYSIRVKQIDQNGLPSQQQYNINVNDINEAPTDLSYDNTTDTTTIDEGQTDGVIGNLISTDQDTGSTFTYSLVTGDGDTDNSLFSIVGNQLIANTVFDFETQTSYSIRVKTEDQGGLSFEKALTINVNDVNEAPTDLSYDNTTDTTAIDEGKPIGTVVGNLISTDQDTGSTFTYSLITGDGDTDNSSFTIVDNQLIANIVFDFESLQTSYSIRVQTTDQGGLTFEKQLNINVNDINGPTDLSFDNTTDTTTINEGQTDSVIGNLISTDPDTGSTFTYSLVSGDGDTDNSSFSIVDNQLQTNSVFNFESKNSYRIRVKTTDQDGLSFEKPLTIGVSNVNERPTDLTLSNSTVAENKAVGTVVGNLTTTDPDTGNTFTYSLVSGTGATDNSLFTIVDNQLQTNSVFNFESKNSYRIRVKTTDQGGLSFEKQLTIGVSNVNETPTNLTLSNSTVAENQVSGTVVGNLSTTDPDTVNTFTYSLVSGTGATDNSLFTITNNQLKTNAVFDFETKNSYRIRIKTTDQSGLSFEKQLTIGVSNVNEAPVITSAATATFAENGTRTVYTVTATDVDAGTTLTYSLSGADANLFNINNRAVTFKTAPNFEAPSDNGANNVYNINVIASDGTLTDTEPVAITVTNVNEPPTLDRPSSGNPFVIKGDNNDKKRLEVKLTGYSSKLNSELGVFTVDDADGKIDGIAPGAPGYTDKALQRGQVIFSLLGNSPVGFDQSRLSRLLEFNSNSKLRFYLVKDGSTDSVLNNTTPKSNVLFDIPSNVRTTTLGNGFSLAWEDGSGNATGFEDLRVTITPTDARIAPGTSVQNKPQRELLDLRGSNTPVTANFVVNREAAYNNFVGFYKVNDENGGIDTDGNGTIDVRPGDANYAQAALKTRVSDLALTVNNNGTANFNNKTLQGNSIFAPFIITNGGTPDNYDNINSRIYFAFGAANSDKVDHVRLLGDNTFGFEDLAGGGDNDFNDVIVKVNLPV